MKRPVGRSVSAFSVERFSAANSDDVDVRSVCSENMSRSTREIERKRIKVKK